MAKNLTPMLAQYTAIKNEHPDVILMFRLGDFYEMFGEDAKTAARELEITLTSREAGKAGRIPMCGVPHHSVDKYIARLISKGYRAAICDQVEDAKQAKGLVRRAVTRIVTPGTVLEDAMLDAGKNNFLLSFVRDEGAFGLAVIDVSTGEFLVTEVSGEEAEKRVMDEIGRLAPAEILVPEEADSAFLGEISEALITPFFLDSFDSARDILLKHFGVSSLRGFGCEDFSVALDAAALVIGYLKKAQPAGMQHIRSISAYSVDGFMTLDAPARRNLELSQSMLDGARGKSLLQVLDCSVTPMGSRQLKRMLDQPLLDVSAINGRLDAVSDFYGDLMMRSHAREVLGGIYDLERLTSRVSAQTANARDLISLKNSIRSIPALKEALSSSKNGLVCSIASGLGELDHIADLIDSAIAEEPPITLKDGGLIKPGFDEQLDMLKVSGRDGKAWIAELEGREKQRSGIKSLKVGYNSVFGYYIEVSKSNLSLVPEDYIRKQTTVGGERFITPELKEYEAIVLGAEERSTRMEYEIFCSVRERVAAEADALMTAARAVAYIDVLAALAETAAMNRYVRPEVDSGTKISIESGRHPVVESFQMDEPFIPNDAFLDCENDQLLIITGPNMAGKSTYLRQVALIVLLAQVGSFVPADSAKIGVVDRIFTRVGAHDELYSGQSTFMVEMTETANILNNATDRSLIILDEVGRGTSTFDGLSIAWAVAEYIKGIGAKTLFATHYHHLNDLAGVFPGIKNFRVAVREDEDRVIWLRKIMPGGTDRSYGIQVARMAGLPREVVDRAQEVLWDLESKDELRGTVRRSVSVAPKSEKVQLTLFEEERHPALIEIDELDVNSITPVEALTKLYEIQKKLRDK